MSQQDPTVVPFESAPGKRIFMSVENDKHFIGRPPRPGDVVEFVCTEAGPDKYWFGLRVREP